ncbi:MAG: chorismate synthase [Clostridiales bacterium]|nr:chorismate synthase [Candidatus Crickella equi]
MKLNFNKIQVNIEGESHSKRIDVEIAGLPKGARFDREELQAFMDRRHGDGSYISELVGTGRHEPDIAEFDEIGTTIKAHIDNKDVRSQDYDKLRTVLRPGHADLGAYLKYGAEGLKPGGGEFSGRMTAAMCLAGGIAKQLLEQQGVEINSYILQMGGMTTAFLDEEDEAEFVQRIEEIASEGDSCGGIVGCVVKNYPRGIGGPGMDGLEGDLARAMLAIPSAKGVEFGSGFEGTYWRGSTNNDEYFLRDGEIVSRSNKQGGISGGISTGMNITLNVAFKPVPTIALEQKTVDIEKMEETVISAGGRHDVCIVPRVMPVVEAMAALVLYDRLIAE